MQFLKCTSFSDVHLHCIVIRYFHIIITTTYQDWNNYKIHKCLDTTESVDDSDFYPVWQNHIDFNYQHLIQHFPLSQKVIYVKQM